MHPVPLASPTVPYFDAAFGQTAVPVGPVPASWTMVSPSAGKRRSISSPGARAEGSDPRAHEYDAERAVRAGLELITAVTALKSHASLRTRVGIATGLVVGGDLIGSGEAQERSIVGEIAGHTTERPHVGGSSARASTTAGQTPRF
jgi:hypothetical protein